MRVARGRRSVVVLTAALLVAASCSHSTSGSAPPTTASSSTAAPTTLDPHDPTARAEQAFLWGYPLVVTVRTMQLLASFAGVNHLFWQTSLSAPSLRLIVAPNHDTIYSLAVLDLRAGPMVLTVPEIKGRYYTYQFMDAWMSTFHYVGTRATGGRAGSWVIVPPGWTGSLPPGAQRVAAPTNQVVMLGRFAARGDADVANVLAYRGKVRLAPFVDSAASGPRRAPPIGRPRGKPQAVGSNDDPTYYDELGDALVADAPTSAAGRRILDQLASLGIGPGRHPSTDPARAPTRGALVEGLRLGNLALANPDDAPGQVHNGWRVTLKLGALGDDSDLRQRALVARYFWGPNVPEEAVYPRASSSIDGQALSGAHRYRIHFAPGQLPPVDAFWSITLYGPDMFLVANPIRRYSIGSQTAGLASKPDGSLDVDVQTDAPPGHEANWLPAPIGRFNLVMRLYLPRAPVLDGTYQYPVITRL